MAISPFQSTVISAGLSLLPFAFIRPRSIGGIVANVTIEERGVDDLAITDHPIEQGASITDHAFKMPASITIVAGWSNSALQAFANPNYVTQIYDALLELQISREPFDVITGQRFYSNMLMRRLFKTTDERTENALMVVCECREVILVSTETVSVPPARDMKMPQVNAATENKGTISVRPTSAYNRTVTGTP